jgi:succinate dehydrogenase flavin-adding protein (antitoxin of CptAB toxin-antitoxin module)
VTLTPSQETAMPTPRRAPYTKTHADIRRENLSADSPKEPKRTRPPKRLQREMVEKARAMTDLALARLRDILEDEDADLTHVISAAKEVLNRGWGAVPQHHVVEAMFQHRHTINTDAIKQMSTEQLALLEQMLTPFTQPAEDADVIDHDPNP